MEIDEGRRLRMVERFREVLGSDVTDTVMSYLPPGGWAEVATKGDIAELRGEIAGLRGELRGEMGALRADMIRDNRYMFFGLIGVFTAYAAGLVAVVRLH